MILYGRFLYPQAPNQGGVKNSDLCHIPVKKILTFPCCDKGEYDGYMKRAWGYLELECGSLTHIMSRFFERLGCEFIAGSNSFLFPVEGWTFYQGLLLPKMQLNYFFGPFHSKSNQDILHQHLGYTIFYDMSTIEYLRFDSNE